MDEFAIHKPSILVTRHLIIKTINIGGKKDSEKAEIFCKIEHYLTFLDISASKRARRHTNQVKELEELNQRQLDKVKDYAIAQLSDQLVVITVRLQDLDRKEQI